MTFQSEISIAGDAFGALVEGLQLQFGARDVGALAASILEAERADFHWEARVRDRYLGQYHDAEFGIDDDVEELDRIALMSFLDGQWHAGVALVNGEGQATDLLWLRSFDHKDEAMETYFRAH